MAVNRNLNLVEKTVKFLSRLCGGESFVIDALGLLNFLSRLCGGEWLLQGLERGKAFLSRLCGGE